MRMSDTLDIVSSADSCEKHHRTRHPSGIGYRVIHFFFFLIFLSRFGAVIPVFYVKAQAFIKWHRYEDNYVAI